MVKNLPKSLIDTATKILAESTTSYEYISAKQLEAQAKTMPLKQFIKANTHHQNPEGAPVIPAVYHAEINPTTTDPFEYASWDQFGKELAENPGSASAMHVGKLQRHFSAGGWKTTQPVLINGQVDDIQCRPTLEEIWAGHRI